jgi:hypothetical protein
MLHIFPLWCDVVFLQKGHTHTQSGDQTDRFLKTEPTLFTAPSKSCWACINPLKTKTKLFYITTQFVPSSKHFKSRL